MQELNIGFDVVGGKIDTEDSKRVHQASGYKIILRLKINCINLDFCFYLFWVYCFTIFETLVSPLSIVRVTK